MLRDVSADQYYLKDPVTFSEILQLLLAVTLLAIVMWLGAMAVQYSGKKWLLTLRNWAFLLVLVLPLNGLRDFAPLLQTASLASVVGNQVTVTLIGAICLGAIIGVLRWEQRIVHAATRIVLIVFPFVFFTFGQALWFVAKTPGVRPAQASVPRDQLRSATGSAQPERARIVWLVFDEMDEHVAFAGRPEDLPLPELDRLRSEAVHARSVRSPARTTKESMPALITGKIVVEADDDNPNELLITFEGEEKPHPWSRESNVFTRASEAGFRTALVGWYHPYCRILGKSLNYCSWQAYYEAGLRRRAGEGFFQKMVWIPRLINTLPLAGRVGLVGAIEDATGVKFSRWEKERTVRIGTYLRILKDAKQIVRNPNFDLVLIHLPVPHPPGFFDRISGDFGKGDYLGNLALADRTLGELRTEMESAGIWDKSIVLLTSDHPYRRHKERHPTGEEAKVFDDPAVGGYVPFLLKMAGQKETISYDQPFNSGLIPDLFMGLLKGKISDPQSVLNWLESRNS